MMPERAVDLTGITLPSYFKEDVFVISKLINPTLVVPKGSTIRFTIINLDEAMNHNLALSPFSPPYPYMSMMSSIQVF
jgi:hypothetical protein